MKLTNIKLRLKGGAIMPLKYIKSVNANEKEIDFDELTPEQQMEVRKNLGLYYEESIKEEKIAKHTNEPESSTLPNYIKISDDTPAKEDILRMERPSFPEDYELAFSDREGGYNIHTIRTIQSSPYFIVITDDSQFDGKGIYIGSMAAMAGTQLVYNYPSTVISKIDAKFLPEQESGIPEPATLLSIPTQNGSSIEGIISDEDLVRIINGETNVAKVNNSKLLNYNGSTFVCSVLKNSSVTNIILFVGQLQISSTGITGFSIERNEMMPGYNFYSVKIYNVSSPIYPIITQGLPNGYETEEEIAQIYTSQLFNDAKSGKITHINYAMFNTICSIITATTNRIEFWSDTNIYVVTPTAITVTPR